MKYRGKLYGKVGSTFISLRATSDDIENLQKQIAAVKPMTFEQAEIEAQKCDYAFAAVETEGNEINWGDATGFFLDGYNYARELLLKKQL